MERLKKFETCLIFNFRSLFCGKRYKNSVSRISFLFLRFTEDRRGGQKAGSDQADLRRTRHSVPEHSLAAQNFEIQRKRRKTAQDPFNLIELYAKRKLQKGFGFDPAGFRQFTGKHILIPQGDFLFKTCC